MANKEKGEVGVVVGGKPYTLRPTFDSLCELEDLVGKPLHELIDGIQQGRLSGVRAVTWCFLQDEHATEIKTLKDASKWIEKAGGADAVLGFIHQAFGLNEPEEKAAADPPEAQGGTGEASSSALVESV